MKRWRAAYAASALLVLLFHCRLLPPGRALVTDDLRAAFIALRGGLQNTIAAGEWPWWQRGIFLGYPIVADAQFQLWNPLTWLTLPLDAARGITVQSLCELCLCAVGMVFWMKQRGLRAVESVFAAAAFALCLKQTVHLHHWTFAASTCAWPWMMAGIDGYAATGRSGFLALTSLATAGTWFGGSPQMAYFGIGLSLLYTLSLRRWEPAAALALGIGVAAPSLLPVAELTALGPRGAGVTYRFASSWSWPGDIAWVTMLLPRAWGGRPRYFGPLNYWEIQGYLGLLPMALLPLAPLRRRRLWVFAAITILGLWISFGDTSWLRLHWLAFELLPGYGGFRTPTRALMLTSFCGAVLGAEALARMRDEPPLRWRVLAATAALGICVAVAAYAFDDVRPLRADALVATALLASIAAWSVFAVPRATWTALAIGIHLGDQIVQAWDSQEIGSAVREGHALERFSAYVPPAPAPRRVAVMLGWGESNDATFSRGWEGVTGYGPTAILDVLRLIDATRTGGVLRPRTPMDDDQNFPRLRPDSPLVPLFSAPLLITDRDAHVAPVTTDGEAGLYRIPALPRVYWVGAWRVAKDEESSVLLPAAARGGLSVLREPIAFPSREGLGHVAADAIEVRANSLRAVIDAPEEGLAVVLDPMFPGWKATVDGAPVPLVRANAVFMAAPVGKGRHELRLWYFPRLLLPGVAIAVVACLGLFLLTRRVDTRSTRSYFPPP